MCDLISRSIARHEFEQYFADSDRLQHDCDSILCMLPAVDAVEVVRCKDCKNSMPIKLFSRKNNRAEMVLHCGNSFFVVDPEDFCSRGERRSHD